jgi:hypothetical protein
MADAMVPSHSELQTSVDDAMRAHAASKLRNVVAAF